MGETLTETAGLEKVAQRLAFRIRRTEQRRRLPIEAHDLAEQGQVRRLTRFRRCAKNPLAPRLLYSSPVRRHDTAKDMSESRVATPSSPNSRTRFGYVRSLWTRKPVSSGTAAGRAIDQHRVGVAAETTFLFEQVHPMPAAQQIGRRQTRRCPPR